MSVLSRLPLHPFLLASYAVLFLYAANLREVLLVDALAPLIRSLAGAGAAFAIAAIAFRHPLRGAIVASALVVIFFAFGHAAPVIADAGFDHISQLAMWEILTIVAVVYGQRAGATLPRVTAALNVFALVLVALTLLTIVPYETTRAARASSAGGEVVAAEPDATGGRDIFFLVFDRYGGPKALERRFGITDNDLYGWLEDRGFQVPADSRTSYRATDFALAATLNLRYLDQLTEEIGRVSGDRTPAHRLLRQHEVGRFLKSRGYRYYHLGSWFGPTAANPMADENLSFDTSTEFESVFYDTTAMPTIERLLGKGEEEALTFRDRHRELGLFQLRQIERLASAPGPKFVFAHVLLPHPPYVFRADGSIVPEAEAEATDEGTLYRGQLAYLNGRIKAVVETLLAGPDDSDPIVIVQADEGPLLCRSVDCPEDTPNYFGIRFPILNAMYLPATDARLPDTFTSVNTFRFVFREYFGVDLPLLPNHSYTWPDNDHIYDFRDVTDRLPP